MRSHACAYAATLVVAIMKTQQHEQNIKQHGDQPPASSHCSPAHPSQRMMRKNMLPLKGMFKFNVSH